MDKKEVGLRLRKFLLDKFGKLNNGAVKIGMSPQSLQKYLNGEFIPGGEILSKLSQLGCDIDWLLLGVETKIENVSDASYKEYISRKDKIILSQAEELTMLKVKIEELKQRVLELEEESRILSSMKNNKNMKQVKEESRGKQKELK